MSTKEVRPLTMARTLRTLAFRWAVKEYRKSRNSGPSDRLVSEVSELAVDGNFETSFLLREFFQHCCRTGTLSSEEYELLCRVKLEGFEAKEVAKLYGGLTSAGVRGRLQRMMRRLRHTTPQKAKGG